jgi:hypothetical protein
VQEYAKVVIHPQDFWNVFSLSCEQWLFNPSLCCSGSGGWVVVANSAESATHIWTVDGLKGESKKALPACFEPKYVESGDQRILMWRKCPERYSAFFNSKKSRMADELLPLEYSHLDAAFAPLEIENLSKGHITGGSFIFDLTVDPEGALVLATIGGLLQKPMLQIIRSPNAGKAWAEIGSVALSEVPRYLTVAANGKEIVAAIALNPGNGSEVRIFKF